MPEPTGTHPFAPFEWMLSLRYLRARRKEGFISVIAGFSFLGIMLGVATPSMMPRKEKPAMTEMKPSLRRARR